MTTIVISARIETEGPLSISMPVPEGGRPNEYNNAPVMARGVDEDGNLRKTGYLPATTVRGFLRRAAVLPDMQAAAESGHPFSLPRIYADLLGQDADSEKSREGIDLVAIRKLRESSPVVDLFGSGLGVKSRLYVSNFLPAMNVLPQPFSGVRKDLDDTEEVLNLMSSEDQDAFLSRSYANSERARAAAVVDAVERKLRKAKKDGEDPASLQAERNAAQALVDKYEGQMGEMQNSTRTLLTWWALPAGLTLSGRLVIDRPQDRDLELVMRGLEELSLHPIFGAHRARGCGEVSGSFDFMRDGRVFRTVQIGGYVPAIANGFSAA